MSHKGGQIDHCTHVPGTVAQYSAKSKYSSEYTAGTALSHFRMINNELLNKDTYLVPEQAHKIISDSK